jgi:hypothetical protein
LPDKPNLRTEVLLGVLIIAFLAAYVYTRDEKVFGALGLFAAGLLTYLRVR